MTEKYSIFTDVEFFDYAESILFCQSNNACVDYERLDAESHKYDVCYEKSIRSTNLNLIYILDEIKQEMGFSGSHCIDTLIKIEFILCHARTRNNFSVRDDLYEEIVFLSDCIGAECDFISARMSEKKYMNIKNNMLHLNPVSSKKDLLQALRLFAKKLKKDVSFFARSSDTFISQENKESFLRA